jgi:hypothetical protein
LDAIAFDAELRDTTHLYARHGFIDEQHVAALKNIAAESADDPQSLRSLRVVLEKFGATDPNLPDWRQLTRKLAQAELAALEVSVSRDEGDQDPPMPAFLDLKPVSESQGAGPAVSLTA